MLVFSYLQLNGNNLMIKTIDKKKIRHNYANFAYFHYILIFITDTQDLLKHAFSSFYRHNILFLLHVFVFFTKENHKFKSQMVCINVRVSVKISSWYLKQFSFITWKRSGKIQFYFILYDLQLFCWTSPWIPWHLSNYLFIYSKFYNFLHIMLM